MTTRPSGSAPDARSIAAEVLMRVERDGAYAAVALDAELTRRPDLDQRERRLATELAYGVLRTRGALLKRIEPHAPRGIDDSLVLIHLLIAAYQILILERVPAFAAVDAAVGAVNRARNPRVGGFVNAVLRRIASSGEKLERGQALRESAPPWLVERLISTVGASETDALLGAQGEAPRSSLRLVLGATPEWLSQGERGKVSPLAVRIPESASDPRKLKGFAEGEFVVQEEGAQVVALALGARAGESVLDACAGRGQKTSLLREQVGPGARLWATDLHPRKLEKLTHEFARLKLEPPETSAVDYTVGSGGIAGDFDRVLVDAPCSGTGTLRRRPEIINRLTPDDPSRLGELAAKILSSAAELVRPGGRVVFAVCSVLGEEAEDVVARAPSFLEPAAFDAPALASWLDQSVTAFRLLPGAHGTDGYFVASFRRRA